MKRQSLIFMLLLAVACTMTAKPRTSAQLRMEAEKALKTNSLAQSVRAKKSSALKVLRQNTQITVMGYTDGGYAVIANDDTFSPVLGYSDATLTDNPAPAFLWWMEAINASLEKKLEEGQQPAKVQPSAEYKDRVDELLTTRWNQDAPYNITCPTYTVNGIKRNYVTGCVATAMAQIMYYHKYPTKGKGNHLHNW